MSAGNENARRWLNEEGCEGVAPGGVAKKRTQKKEDELNCKKSDELMKKVVERTAFRFNSKN